MMKYLFLALIVSACMQGSCTYNSAHGYPVLNWNPAKKLQFLSYGLTQSRVTNAEAVVAAKWGFEYRSLTGCVVTPKLVDSIRNHNAQVERLLTAQYGGNWHSRFNAEVDRETRNEMKTTAIVNEQPEVIATRNQLKKTNSNVFYHLNPVQGQHLIYEAEVIGPGRINGQYTYVDYFKYLIDLDKNTVKLVSNTSAKR